MKLVALLALLWLLTAPGCSGPSLGGGEPAGTCKCRPGSGKPERMNSTGIGGLLATRFESLEEFKEVVRIEYYPGPDSTGKAYDGVPFVRLTHCSNGREVVSILEQGLSQDDIMKVKSKGGFWDKLGLVFDSPFSIVNRFDLRRVYILARRAPYMFGEGDPAFYDFAETSVSNINTFDLAYLNEKDSTEKGYINTFNHITGQAFISTIFSEEMADFIADLHERKNMPELVRGNFTPEQLADPNNNPLENYVDLINNEWGQELGKQLKEKYHIDRETSWTPRLLADYLNDIQSYYSWAFQIGFHPYRQEDELVIRFANKINLVMTNNFEIG